MAVQVLLDGDEEFTMQVPMSGIDSTETLLRACFDACAESVGMELQASQNQQIVLRYVTSGGRERKLNTKVSWEDLRRASIIIIQLKSVDGRGHKG